MLYDRVGDSILKLTIKAEDGENGFPGKVMAVTTYKVTADNILDITWEAETDKPTIINQTNHNYYNLSGDFTQPAYDMVLYVNADNFTPSDKLYIPTGEIKSVEGTPMDFRQPHALGDSINSQFDQIQNATGYDHNYCLNTYKDGKGDHEFINTVADRIIELTPKGTIDKLMTYDDYIYDEQIKEQQAKMYA